MATNRTNRVQYHCSFCGKNQDQVRRLIAGPGAVYICDECVDLCREIIDEENGGGTTTATAKGPAGTSQRVPPPKAIFEIRREGSYQVEQMGVEGRDQIVCMLENFGRAVLEKKPVAPDPEEAVKTLRVLDALTRSAREGKPVDV